MAVVNIEIDPGLQREAQALFERLGYGLDEAVDLFLRQAVREQAIPFPVEGPNAETRRAIANVRNGVGLSRGFSSVEELLSDLNADDAEVHVVSPIC